MSDEALVREDSGSLKSAVHRPARRRLGTSWIILLVVGAALVAWMGVRIAGALKIKDAVAKERETVAAAAVEAKAAPSSAVAAVAGRWQPQVQLDGTLLPIRETDLGFKAGGRLHTIRVRLGDRVRAGEVLASLERAEAEAQLAAAEAQVRASEAQLALADDSARRTGSLVGSGAASQQSGVMVSQQRQLAAAQVDAARAQRELAAANLRNHTLTAPFSGVVTKVPGGPGAIVAPGVALFHIQDSSTLKLGGTVGEADASLVKPGAEVSLTVGGRPVKGKVVAVLSSVDAATRRVPVEAEIKNDGATPLLGGAFVRASVTGLAPVDIVRVPASTLRPGSQNEVMVVNGSRLEARRLIAQVGSDGGLIVRTGLVAGERVLIGPSAEAKDGDAVVLK